MPTTAACNQDKDQYLVDALFKIGGFPPKKMAPAIGNRKRKGR